MRAKFVYFFSLSLSTFFFLIYHTEVKASKKINIYIYIKCNNKKEIKYCVYVIMIVIHRIITIKLLIWNETLAKCVCVCVSVPVSKMSHHICRVRLCTFLFVSLSHIPFWPMYLDFFENRFRWNRVCSFVFHLLFFAIAHFCIRFCWILPKRIFYFLLHTESRCKKENNLMRQMQKRCKMKCWFCISTFNDNEVAMWCSNVSVHKRIQTHTHSGSHMYKPH